MRTCTSNLKEYLPDEYHNITRNTIAEMMVNEGYMNNTHVIQISTCHRFASVYSDTRETLLTFTNTEHSLSNIPIQFYPDSYEKKRISIENLPIELPDKEVKAFLSKYATLFGKTYYPGTKFQNKYFTTGTRIYQYTSLSKHIPRHINEFGRYLQIRYDEQPKDDNNLDTQSEFPRNVTYIQQEAPQTLPNATPTPQLPDTPTIIPETQQQDEPQVEQQQTTPIRKENLINSKVQQTQRLPKQIIQQNIPKMVDKINNVQIQIYKLRYKRASGNDYSQRQRESLSRRNRWKVRVQTQTGL